MYDLIIVGAGPAGYEAALKAASLQKKVLLIEKDEIGGTCLNYGCVPTKSLLAQTASFSEILKNTSFLLCDNLSVDYLKILENKNKNVDRMKKGVEFLLKKNNVDIIRGEASLENNNSVKVNDQEFTGDNILLALGSKSVNLNIEGFDNCIDSKQFLQTDLTDINKVVIIGGGVIGVEIATILTNLKIKVTIIEAQERLILNSDQGASLRLKKILNRSGVIIKLNTFIERIEKGKVFADGAIYEGDLIISCVGRTPNTNSIDPLNILEKEQGFIKVDSTFKTNIDNIYAVGDCIKGLQLAHYAKSCALNVVNNLYSNQSLYNLKNIPQCIYTSDEIAFVGSFENDNDLVVQRDFIANPKAVIENQNKGFLKLVFTREGFFKGATLMCPRASDMINIFVTALNNKLSIQEMAKDVYPHPSFSEAIGDIISQAI
ncbi:MAG: NAD(P)/FAD-dependent oxidoreductase [Sphaerochaetaceae bacterium]|nr:NAD(P)/FAD-dependent oxidoreductase [Sphaerochaetaceae bacterium]